MKKLIIALLVIALTSPVYAKDEKYWAAYAAQELIGQTLKAPSTAQWPGLETFDVTPVKGKSNSWHVSGYVDSQNSYGAMIRTHFKATIKKDKNGDMLLVGLKKRP